MVLISSEARHRHRIVEQSIAGARQLFADPHVYARLGKMGNILIQLCDDAYVPNVKDGLIAIPKQHRGQQRVPILAMMPGETLRLAPEFALLTPQQRIRATRQIASWQPRGFTPESMVDRLEDDAYKRAQSANGLAFRNLFTKRPLVPAQTSSSPSVVPVDLAAFDNVGNKPHKVLLSSPVVCLRYEGRQTPPLSPAVLAHEKVHVLQHWIEAFSTLPTDPKKQERRLFRRELIAYNVGALVGMGMLDSGMTFDELGSPERTHLRVESERLQTNAERQDPFEPNGTIMNSLKAIGMDFTAT